MATRDVLTRAVHVLRLGIMRFHVNSINTEMNLQQLGTSLFTFIIIVMICALRHGVVAISCDALPRATVCVCVHVF